MATQLFFRHDVAGSGSRGTNEANLAGVNLGWGGNDAMSLTRGTSGIIRSMTATTVTGPTAGIEVGTSGGTGLEFISDPVAAAVTVSGTMTFNLWMNESNMSANAGAQCVVERVDSTGAVASTIANSEFGTEMGSGASTTAQNWTATPTSTNLLPGDRIRVRVACNDVGTMAAGFTVTFKSDATTANAGTEGDSWIQFTESVTFFSGPTGSELFLTDTASAISPGSATSKDAWTSRGSGSVNSVTNSVAGFTDPIQVTDSAGGTALEWYSHPLTAFTLSGICEIKVRAKVSAACHCSVAAEVAVCASDGTSAAVWGRICMRANSASGSHLELSTTDTPYTVWVSGNDTAISNGQRLRFRLLIDDNNLAMTAGQTITYTYSGPTVGVAGDTSAILPQTVTEFSSANTYTKTGFGKEHG